jgi:VanZ family protein
VVGIDKVVHAALFAVLAVTTRWRFGRGLAWVLLYAVLSEVAQQALPIHRDGSVLDALADAGGAAVGWWLVRHGRGLVTAGPERTRRP